MRAFIFPGQGEVSVGMGKALSEASPVAREVFQEVDDSGPAPVPHHDPDGSEDQPHHRGTPSAWQSWPTPLPQAMS